jgi:hypothetical protein
MNNFFERFMEVGWCILIVLLIIMGVEVIVMIGYDFFKHLH